MGKSQIISNMTEHKQYQLVQNVVNKDLTRVRKCTLKLVFTFSLMLDNVGYGFNKRGIPK